jgi:phage terminase large subunit-like protein
VSRRLAHGSNPVTRWMAANVAVAQGPAGNLKPAKDKSTERIDGIVPPIMAIGRAMVVQGEPQPSTPCSLSEAPSANTMANRATPRRRWTSSSPAG